VDKKVAFTKASACGNDFLLIDLSSAPPDIAEFTRRICNRHNGVGADGVEWMSRAKDADITARLVNADGTDAEISGNGTRCVAAYVASQTGKQSVAVATGAGIKLCEMTSHNGAHFEFKSDMGVPKVGTEYVLHLKRSDVRGVTVSMGNPHFVIFVDNFAEGWQQYAAEVGANEWFREGTNVELVRVRGKHDIEIRIFERGVGETNSSGTGSSAAAVASIATGRAQSGVQVHAPGGKQLVEWDKSVFLHGPAQLICRGDFFL
jgi:diaminopimelate epimerase